MNFSTMYFSHARAVQAAAAPLGLAVSTQHADFSLHLAGAGRAERWPARFVSRVGGRLMYTEQFVEETVGFAGWMPYALRRWTIATDKSAFKRHATEAGIPTPAAGRVGHAVAGPFLVKQPHSSFGEGIRGPFLHYDSLDPEQELADGEYYEDFIPGTIAKAWCWGTTCVALELDAPSAVTGDGRATLRQLVGARPNARQDNDWKLVAALARYCGIATLDEVVPAGMQVLIEFRYGSRYQPPQRHNTNVLGRHRDSGLGVQLARAAERFARGISPDPQRRQSLYTLDAIVDGGGRAWFLEMNCHPLVHPDAYGAMLDERSTAATRSQPLLRAAPDPCQRPPTCRRA